MDFSCTKSDKFGLEKHLPFQNSYFLAIFLAYKEIRVVKIIKLKRNECILTQLKAMKVGEPDKMYHATWENRFYQADTRRFVFDYNSRFVAWVEDRRVSIGNLVKPKVMKPIFFEHDKEKYETILDVSLISESEDKYELLVACKVLNLNQIHLYDAIRYKPGGFFYSQQQDIDGEKFMRDGLTKESTQNCLFRQFNFNFQPGKNFQVRINAISKKLLLTNQDENLLYSWSDEAIQTKEIMHNENKIVSHIILDHSSRDSEFLMAVHGEYDDHITIMNTQNPNYHLRFKKNIIPNSMNIHDIAFQTNHVPSDKQCQFYDAKNVENISIAIEQMQSFSIHTAVFLNQGNLKDMDEQEDIKFSVNNYSPYSKKTFSWPYFCYVGKQLDSILLMNVFDPNFTRHVIYLNSAADMLQIQDMFITETQDLFCVSLELDKGVCYFRVYTIDLDNSNNMPWENCAENEDEYFKVRMIFEYLPKDVNQMGLDQIFVRGKNLSRHQGLEIFLQHGNQLYNWSSYSNQFKFITRIDSKMSIFSAGELYFKVSNIDQIETASDTSTYIPKQEIVKLVVLSSSYKLETIYEETSNNSQIVSSFVDKSNDHLVLVIKYIEDRGAMYIFKIQCLITNQIYFCVELENSDLIGRLRSEQFQYHNGHIYFQNNIIKIRFDLTNSDFNLNMKENEVFDFYQNVILTEGNDFICAVCPAMDFNYQRLMYIKHNIQDAKLTQIIIVPLLNERKLFLIKEKPECIYQYTTFQRPCLNDPDRNQTLIMCMNLTLSKYYIYTEQGLLINRIAFAHLVERYGAPHLCSPDGLKFLFRKVVQNNEEKYNDLRHQILVIFEINENKINYIKEINVLDSMDRCYQQQLLQQKAKVDKNTQDPTSPGLSFASAAQAGQKKFYEIQGHQWLLRSRMAEYVFSINNRKDVLIHAKMKEKHTDEQDEFIHTVPKCGETVCNENHDRFYYMQSGEMKSGFSTANSMINQFKAKFLSRMTLQTQDFLLNYNSSDMKFNFNDKYIVFFDKSKIQLLDCQNYMLNKQNRNFIDVNFKIDPKDLKKVHIKHIRCGTNEDTLTITLQTRETDQFMTWSITKQQEMSLNDIEEGAQVIWSASDHGQPVVCCSDKTIFPLFDFQATCYDRESQQYIKQRNSATIKSNNEEQKFKMISIQGHRFDTANNNWLLIREHLSLSFSYMSFVIRTQLSKENEKKVQSNTQIANKMNLLMKTKIFDLEPYNYIFNKSTFFLDKQEYENDDDRLEQVLEQFEKKDPDALQLLFYCQFNPKDQSVSNSALKIALDLQNIKAVDSLLTYMSKINTNNNGTNDKFKSLFPALCQFQSFFQYLDKIPTQTIQMKQKYTLKIKKPHSNDLICISQSPTIFIDDNYYKKWMNESPDQKSYPVEIKAISISWILQNEKNIGHQFFSALLQTENLEIYDNKFNKVVIEWTYQQYKTFIILIFVPLFVFNVVCILFGQYFYEQLQSEEQQASDGEEQKMNRMKLRVVAMVLGFLTFIRLVIGTVNLYSLRRIRKQSKLEFCRIILTFVLAFQWASSTKYESTRFTTALVLIFNFIISLYFLMLADGISPFIHIIFKILDDISNFMLIYIIWVLGLADLFWLIGRVQTDDENIPANEISYNSVYESLWWVWNIGLGLSQTDSFFLPESEGSTKVILMLLFFLASFVIVILLLNMLIAIMGDTFSKQSDIAELVLIKEHLQFVIDNWYLNQYAIKDQDRIQYLIVAFNSANNDRETYYENLEQKIEQVFENMESNIENIETRSITQVKQVMNNIDKVVKSISASKEKEAARQTEAYNASVRRTTLRKTERQRGYTTRKQ